MPEKRSCTRCGKPWSARLLVDIIDDHTVFLDGLTEKDTKRHRQDFGHELLVTLFEVAGCCASCAEFKAMNVRLGAELGGRS
jgi:5-methylcytosine-specific restriction endonuclease McrA